MRHTIKSAAEISILFKTAHRAATGDLVIMIKRNDKQRGSDGRVAFIAGKRLGNAPLRNRAKRMMREAAWRAGMPWPGFDVLLVAREHTAEASLEGLVGDIEGLKGRLMGESGKKARRR
ncbi:MAG: ribonuclease P protein component [Coriobacteriales bacterium]|nr:ribonuclease P protein component [Coriobacteriales bacterium]